MADPIEELNMVFQTCGIADPATHNNIINREGFTSLEDLGVLEMDTDVSDMAKRLASRTQAEGRVYLGTVIVKRLQMLVWWVRDHQKHGLPVNAADFNVQVMNQAAEMKSLKRDMAEKEPSVSDLGKFDPDDFDAYEDAFLNLLAQSYGVIREPLRYVIRPETVPETFATTEEQRMYQFPLAGNSFELDNQSVYRKLKAFLIDSPGWAWIEPHDTAENGRAAYMAWTTHYNGEGELSKQTAIAKAKLDQLHYNNERSMSFEKCTKVMTKCFNTLHKDPDQHYSDRQKIEKLLKAIKCQEGELLAAKVVVDQQYPRDFVGACGYFSQQVARIHGPAQLEYKQQRGKKRGIYAINTRQDVADEDVDGPGTAADAEVMEAELEAEQMVTLMRLTGSMLATRRETLRLKNGKRLVLRTVRLLWKCATVPVDRAEALEATDVDGVEAVAMMMAVNPSM